MIIMANDMSKKRQLFAEMMANSMDERVERMVFCQEDLEALIQKDEREIIICTDGIHIPLDYVNVDYFGYQKPTVIIDTDKIVDFDELGINIENCLFDEAYSKLLYEAGATEQKIEENDYVRDVKEEVNEEEYEDEGEGLDIQEFYDDMKEYFSDYRGEIMEMKVSEDFDDFFDVEDLCENYESDGDYEYESKAKAKLACKEALERIVDDIKEKILFAVSDYMSHTTIFFADLNDSFEEFLKDISDAYDSCASMDCEEEAKVYVMSKKQEFFSIVKSYGKGISTEDIQKVVMKDLNKRFSVRALLQECYYDDDGEDYCYEFGSATDIINDSVESLVCELEATLPQQVYGAYKSIFIYALNELEEKFDEIFTE